MLFKEYSLRQLYFTAFQVCDTCNRNFRISIEYDETNVWIWLLNDL